MVTLLDSKWVCTSARVDVRLLAGRYCVTLFLDGQLASTCQSFERLSQCELYVAGVRAVLPSDRTAVTWPGEASAS